MGWGAEECMGREFKGLAFRHCEAIANVTARSEATKPSQINNRNEYLHGFECGSKMI
jgi:hypothetical protein